MCIVTGFNTNITKNDKTNPNRIIRIAAFRSFGWTKEAKQDEYFYIRLNYYLNNGFDKSAIYDKNYFIRMKAKEFFKKDKEAI